MSQIFLSILNMSLSASYIVLAVLLLRLILKKAPKWIAVLLWGIVALRLICPFSIESVMSLIPSAEVVSPDIMIDQTPEINTGIPIVNDTLNPIIVESFSPAVGDSANPLQIIIPFLTAVWIVGIAALLVYTAVSYLRLKRKIGTAVLIRDNIYKSENIASPFVLGLIKPKIYLPFNMSEKDASHVIAHENAHIRRKDYLWKPIGFLLLTLHWFNPLMWLGYVLLCRDIELACDEKVIGQLDRDARADYSEALLSCSVSRRMIAACPLAFGEVGVKERVRSVLSYKKPAFWIIIIAVVACVAVAVCFLTDPKAEYDNEAFSCTQYTEIDGKLSAVRLIDFSQETVDSIISILNYSKGEKGMTNCACDFEFKLRDATVTYHSECGTLVDKDRGLSAMLSEDTWDELNSLLGVNLAEHTEYKGVYITQSSAIILGSNERNFYVVWHNETDREVIYGDAFMIEQQIDGKWDAIEYPVKDYTYLMGLLLQPHSTAEKTYTVDNYDKLTDGKYRFAAPFSIKEGEDYKHYKAYAEFYVGIDTSYDNLRKLYPEYFGIDASNGLDVYVWQMGRNSFSFGLLPHSDQPRDRFDKEAANLKGTSAEYMRAILSTYNVDESQIYIVPWWKMWSSYSSQPYWLPNGEVDEAKRQEYLTYVRNLLFGRLESEKKQSSVLYKAPNSNLLPYLANEAKRLTVEDGSLYTVVDGIKKRIGAVKKTQITHFNYDVFDTSELAKSLMNNNKTAYELVLDSTYTGLEVYYIMEQKTGETVVVYGEYKNGEKQHDVKYIFSVK